MTVPVYWVSLQLNHPDAGARGYADQALLEAMFARDLWTPPDAVVFDHHELIGMAEWPATDGAVVVFSGMMHDTDAEQEILASRINGLDWSVTVVCGDESYKFNHRRLLRNQQHRVWIMGPWPQHDATGADWMIPGGWYPQTRQELAKHHDLADARPTDVMFAGQVTHRRREQAVAAIRTLPKVDRVWVHETDGFLKGVSNAQYMAQLAAARLVVSPSGPITPDTARTISALEAGCIPIVDSRSTHGPVFDYWRLVFGKDHPLTVIDEWGNLRREVAWLLPNWQGESLRVWAWWQQWKRHTVRLLDDHVRRASQQGREVTCPDDDITVVITTSVVPGHPSTADIEQVVCSIRAQLPTAEIIIACDGVRPEQAGHTGDYRWYLRRLLWLCNFQWTNVLPVVLSEFGHQANAAREALAFVRTSQILFVEHDTPIVGPIDWASLHGMIAQGTANVIRLHQDVEIHDDHQVTMASALTMVDVEATQRVVPCRRTKVWWQRPHLASTAFYRNMLAAFFPVESRTMIEDRMYPIVWVDHDTRDPSALARALEGWALFVYHPNVGPAEYIDTELGIRRSGHLDSRGEQPKFDMDYGASL